MSLMSSLEGLFTDIEIEPNSAALKRHPHPEEKADLALGYF